MVEGQGIEAVKRPQQDEVFPSLFEKVTVMTLL